MKNISDDLKAILANRFCLDYSFQVEIYWSDDPTIYTSEIESISEVVDSADSIVPGADFSCTLVLLDDENKSLSQIFNTKTIVDTLAKIYITFETGDKILVGSGYICTPVEYFESKLSLSVYSGLIDNEVGFSSADGNFYAEVEDAKSWPMIFGKVCAVDALELAPTVVGRLLTEEGIADYTLPARICQVQNIQCPVFQTGGSGFETNLEGDDPQGTPYPDFWWIEPPEMLPDQSCVNARRAEYCRLVDDLAEQRKHEHKTLEVLHGIKFPQGKKIDIRIDGGVFTGYFTGNTFTIQQRKHPAYDRIGPVSCENIPKFSMSYVDPESIDGFCDAAVPYEYTYQGTLFSKANEHLSELLHYCLDSGGHFWTQFGGIELNPQTTSALAEHLQPDNKFDSRSASWQSVGAGPRVVLSSMMGNIILKEQDGSEESINRYYSMPSAGLFTASPGAEVKLSLGANVVYLVSIVPGTLLNVKVYKTQSGGHASILVDLPTEFYDIVEVDYGGYIGIEIHMDKRPSDFDPCLDDTLYVEFDSDIGPNPVDIIEWLVTKYTDLGIDTESFNITRSLLENYPIGFILRERPKVMQLVKDIAYQARCVLYIYDHTLYIKYYSLAPTAAGTISESDIYFGTMKVRSTDEVTTYREIEWSKYDVLPKKEQEDSDKEKLTVTLEHNLKKYGSHKDTQNYYTINNKPLVVKTATFWMLRDSNYWKEVEFEGPLSLLVYNIYDCVYYTPYRTLAVIKSLEVLETGVKVKLWLPIRFGSSVEYFWAWPAHKAAWSKLSNYLDIIDNDQPSVSAPSSHIMSATSSDFAMSILGDEYPSDLDDSLYDIYCNDVRDYHSVPCDLKSGSDEIDMDKFVVPTGKGTPPELKPVQYAYNGSCWWYYNVGWGCAEEIYCGQLGPCTPKYQTCPKGMRCKCAPVGGGGAADSKNPLCDICYTKFFTDCAGAYGSWAADAAEAKQQWSRGQCKVVYVHPQTADSCFDIPHKFWKSPNQPGNDSMGKYRDYWHLDSGLEVSEDYYCDNISSSLRFEGCGAPAERFLADELERPGVVSSSGPDTTSYGQASTDNICDDYIAGKTIVKVGNGMYGDPMPRLDVKRGNEGEPPPSVPDDIQAYWYKLYDDNGERY